MLTLNRRRPSLLPLLLLLVLTPAGVCVAQGAGAAARAGDGEFKVTTVFLVRHAEKLDAPGEKDPPLSDAGRARSEALARLLERAGVRAVYTSQYARARQTGEAVARRLGVEAVPVALGVRADNPRQVSEQSVRELTGRIEAHAGGAVLVVGHSNSVPDVIRALGGDAVPTIDEKTFDDLFVVTVHAPGRARVVHLKYGGAN